MESLINNPEIIAALVAGIGSIAAAVAAMFKSIEKRFLNELKPNHGSSLKDRVVSVDQKLTQLEKRVDEIYQLLATKGAK